MLTMRPVIVGLGLSKTWANVLPELLQSQIASSSLNRVRSDLLADNAAHDALVVPQQQKAAATAEPNGRDKGLSS